MNNWLPLPHTVHCVSLTALNASETSHKSLLKLCSNWRTYLSSSYQFIFFPSEGFFLLWKGPQNEKLLFTFWDIMIYPKVKRTQWKNHRTSKLAMHRGLLVFSGLPLFSQDHRSNACCMQATAVGLKQNCVTQQDDERKSSETVLTE